MHDLQVSPWRFYLYKLCALSKSPIGVSVDKIQYSSSTWGTWDCTQKVHLFGSRPKDKKIVAISRVLSIRAWESLRLVSA